MPTAAPTIRLNDGVEIPQLGFGTYQIDPDDTTEAVATALDVGYRHVDTAQMYGNEAEVGEAVRSSGLDRGEVFVTTKLDNGFHAHDDAVTAIDRSLAALGLDHVDLFLIHWPLPSQDLYVEAWTALQEAQAVGKTRSIGVSNFQPHHLDRLARECDVVPSVDQIEVHPYFPQTEVRAEAKDRGIVVEAWSPIAQGDVLDDPAVTALAEDHDATPAQVVLAWHLQRGDVVFPKSSNRERMEENWGALQVTLTDDEVARLTALGRDDGRRGPDPDEMG